MIITIADLLSEQELEDTNRTLNSLSWRDGAETAGATARAVKRNEQADLTSRAGARLREALLESVKSHPVLDAYAQPARFTRPLISRSKDNGGYGLHIDNPFMEQPGERVRTDLSFTLFLNDPDEYEGGELCIELAGVTHKVKERAGDMVIYPSTTLHRVDPVTKGERIVCVGWIESRIRSAEDREILFDLINLKTELSQSHNPNSPEMLVLTKTIANLKRKWMD